MNKHIDLIQKVFNEFNGKNTDLLDGFYAKDVIFMDPLHKVSGLLSLKKYYTNMYKNVQSIHFNFKNFVVQEEKIVGFWTMSLQAKGLNQGREFQVEGTSLFIFNSDGKVQSHRDYLDLGEMVYEKIFGLGYIIKKIKTLLNHK